MANQRICSVPDCGKQKHAKGFCQLHYVRHVKTGSTSPRQPEPRYKCAIETCDRPAIRRGDPGAYCRKHNQRCSRHGGPTVVKVFNKGEAADFFERIVIPYTGGDCLTWPFARTTHGYATFMKNGKRVSVHRAACEAENGPPPTSKHFACHRCGNGQRGCVSPTHLYWGTAKENQADRIVHGTSHRGTNSPTAKLTEEQVREIRLLDGHIGRTEIGRMYGVNHASINGILTGKRWGWLK